jgi:hypothetical protein
MNMIEKEKVIPPLKWRRYRLKTKAVDDYRPLVSDPRFPWWCSGHGIDGDCEISDSTIIAWLPFDEPIQKYWDDADQVEFTEHETIVFTDRFPKPEWFVES